MSGSATSSTVQLGAYVGNPNNSDASEEAATNAQFNSLAAAMGQAPTLMDTYIDQSIPQSQWASYAQWDAVIYFPDFLARPHETLLRLRLRRRSLSMFLHSLMVALLHRVKLLLLIGIQHPTNLIIGRFVDVHHFCVAIFPRQ